LTSQPIDDGGERFRTDHRCPAAPDSNRGLIQINPLKMGYVSKSVEHRLLYMSTGLQSRAGYTMRPVALANVINWFYLYDATDLQPAA
jgi:hypothetical protein